MSPRERPILYSGPMVRALLREIQAPGTGKTQTRRLLTHQTAHFGSAPRLFWEHANLDQAWVDGKGTSYQYLHVPCHRGDEAELQRLDAHWASKGQPPGHGYRKHYPDSGSCEVCDHWGWRMTSHRLWPRVQPGDRLLVRETWQMNEPPSGAIFRADDIAGHIDGGWRPSIFMPRWASRISCEVTGVRIERLQDISVMDAKAEGLSAVTKDGSLYKYGIPDRDGLPGTDDDGWPWSEWSCDPREAFRTLWEANTGKRAPRASNPRVLVYEFRPQLSLTSEPTEAAGLASL